MSRAYTIARELNNLEDQLIRAKSSLEDATAFLQSAKRCGFEDRHDLEYTIAGGLSAASAARNRVEDTIDSLRPHFYPWEPYDFSNAPWQHADWSPRDWLVEHGYELCSFCDGACRVRALRASTEPQGDVFSGKLAVLSGDLVSIPCGVCGGAGTTERSQK